MSKVLSKDAILNADDMKSKKVDIPEWDGHVFIRMMNGHERDAWESHMLSCNESGVFTNIRARLAAYCCVDDKGVRLFEDGDIESLGEKSSAALDRIFAAAQSLNKITDKDIEDLEKN